MDKGEVDEASVVDLCMVEEGELMGVMGGGRPGRRRVDRDMNSDERGIKVR